MCILYEFYYNNSGEYPEANNKTNGREVDENREHKYATMTTIITANSISRGPRESSLGLANLFSASGDILPSHPCP